MQYAADTWRRFRLTRWDALAAVVLAAAALLVRWPFIQHGESFLKADEAVVGLMAQDIAGGVRYPVYFYGQRYMGTLEAYVVAGLLPWFADSVVALRLGPALFFAALVAVEYLVLTRWFGRAAAFLGVASLLGSSPFFVQWSIAARGGYIEVLLCGMLLWWAYGEWCAARPEGPTRIQLFLLGSLTGFGLWLNPAIMAFLLPIAAHALLAGPLASWSRLEALQPWIARIERAAGDRAAVLAVVAGVILLLVPSLWSVRISDDGVEHVLLLGLVPRAIAAVLLVLLVAATGLALVRVGFIERLRPTLPRVAPFLFGALVGMLPHGVYVAQRSLAGLPLEGALPLGPRPIWAIPETLGYLISGLPMLFGDDLFGVFWIDHTGRDYPPIVASGMSAGFYVISGWTSLIVLGVLLIATVWLRRDDWLPMFRLEGGPAPPFGLLLLGFTGLVVMYLMSGFAINITTIRYLLPLWAMLPGILAAAAATPQMGRVLSGLAVVMIAGWVVGQLAFASQLSAPHPLRAVAAALKANPIAEQWKAEPRDAQLLSFFTAQRPAVAEYRPWWARLAHYEDTIDPKKPIGYVVHLGPDEGQTVWNSAGWPGAAPPELHRTLAPALRAAVNDGKAVRLDRKQLANGYEAWILREPLPETPVP